MEAPRTPWEDLLPFAGAFCQLACQAEGVYLHSFAWFSRCSGRNGWEVQSTLPTSFQSDDRLWRTKKAGGVQAHQFLVVQVFSSALLPVFREGAPTKRDYRKTGTLLLTSLLEDVVVLLQRT